MYSIKGTQVLSSTVITVTQYALCKLEIHSLPVNNKKGPFKTLILFTVNLPNSIHHFFLT